MPTIVNQSFFIRNLTIPNCTSGAGLERILSYIAKYEPECLLKIFGYPLYKLFGTESSSRMTDLLNGAEYNDGEGNLQKWQGLKHDTDISLIANYVYFYYQQTMAQLSTGSGTSVSNPESAEAVSPAEKMANAWNFFSSEVYDMTHFLWLKKDGSGTRVYPEFSYDQFLETRRISRPIDPYLSF